MSEPIRSLQGARFACQKTGFCCRFHQLGPVRAACIQALTDSDPASWWPPAARAPWYRAVMGPRGMAYELTRVDGHCVFLGDDDRCAIYTHLGADARPGFCRLFPFQLVDDGDGITITVRESCAGRLGALTAGPPVADQAEQALRIAREGAVVARFSPDAVTILPGWSVDPGTWRAWERSLVAELPRDRDADGLVAWVRDLLAARGGADLPTPDPARARLALRAVLAALDLTLQQVAQAGAAPSPAEGRFVAEGHARIQAAAAALAAGTQAPVPDGAHAYLAAQLADLLLGKQVHGSGSVAAGLGRFLVLATVARQAAAGDAGRLSLVYSHLARLSQNRALRAVLAKAAPALHDAFLHAGA